MKSKFDTKQIIEESNHAIAGDSSNRKKLEDALDKSNSKLSNRVKELEYFYNFSELIETKNISLEMIFQGVVDLIPPAWKYPEITCAKLAIDGREFSTKNYKESKWQQTGEILLNGTKAGLLVVGYLHKKPEADEGVFLKEEQYLLDAICERVGRITERLNAEDAKQENINTLRRLATVVRDSNDAIIMHDFEGKILAWNRGAAEIYGYSKAEALGMNVKELVAEPDRKAALALIKKIEKGEIVKSLELRRITKDGRKLDVWLTITTLADDNGVPEAISSTERDITERKQAEEALRNNQKRYEKAQAMGHVGNWEFDPVTKNFWGSDEAKRIYGFELDRENLTIENVESCIPERERVHQALVDLIEHDKKYDLIFDIITFDKGIRKTIHSIAEVERDARSDWIKVTGVISDITEQKRVEKALQESELKHRTYIEQAPIGIFVANNKGKYIDVNPGACALLGYTRDELLDLSVLDISARKEDAESFGQLMKEGKVSFESKLKKKDGSVVDVILDAVSIPNDQFIAFCIDITERKKYTHDLQQERDKAQKYLDIVEVMIVALNSNGEITLINNKGNKVLAYEEDELIGENWFESCIPEGKRKEVKQVFKKIMAGEIESAEYFENTVMTKSGEERIIAWHNSPLCNEKGHNIGLLSSGEDITKRNRSRQLLIALNQASGAMGTALSQQDIFNAVAKELKQLYISCMLFLMDETKNRLLTSYMSFDSALVNEIAKLVGINPEEFLFKIDDVDIYRTVIWEKESILVTDSNQVVRQILPKGAKMLSSKIVDLLRVQKGIFAPLIVEEQVIGVFSIQSSTLTEDDIPATTAFAHELAGAWNKGQLVQDLRKTIEGTIHTIAATAEARDPYTAGHQARVADLAVAIASEMSLSVDQVEGIKMAGIVHDLGKIQIPAEILSKPGKITDLEFELIKTHPQIGFDILKGIEFPWPIAQIVYQHHEKINGSGYPQRLKGDEILLEARILSVADIVEAMSSHRPYRPALGIDIALAQIKQDKGTFLDPKVVDACIKIFKEGYILPMG